MKSDAATVEAYLASLAEDRRAAVGAVRSFIVKRLGKRFEERMQYGVIAYCVPHDVWPQGHHTNPKLPLMYMGLSSQKNDMVVYMLMLFQNEAMRAWFNEAWGKAGRKSHLEVSGAGCCVRFKRLEDISLEVIGEAIRRMPVAKYLADHAAYLERLGKGPVGKAKKAAAKKTAVKKAAVKKAASGGKAGERKRVSGVTAKKR